MAEYRLVDYLGIIRKWKWIIICAFLITLSSTIYFTPRLPLVYQATSVIVSAYDMETRVLKGPGYKPYVPILDWDPKFVKAAARLLGKSSEEAPGISIRRIPKSNMVKLTATSTDPQEAVETANAYAKAYVEVNFEEKKRHARAFREFIEGRLSEANSRLQASRDVFREANEGEELEFAKREVWTYIWLCNKLEKMYRDAQMREASETNDVAITEPAGLTTVPARDRVTKIFVGATSGLILGLIFAFVKESLEISIGKVEDAESLLNLPVLGVIPYLRPTERTVSSQLTIHYSLRSPIREAYRMLQTNIRSLEGVRTLLITSAVPEEGKSFTAANLSITLAQMGSRVLLVSSDLSRPFLESLFGIEREPGFVDVLLGRVEWEEVLQTKEDILKGNPRWEKVLSQPGLEKLKILPTGPLLANAPELIEGERMAKLIKEVKAKFDMALFDSPPILGVAAATILGSRLDGAILVHQPGKAPTNVLLRARAQLDGAGIDVKGIVLNRVTRWMRIGEPYYYHYR